jgi:hypothetical protein
MSLKSLWVSMTLIAVLLAVGRLATREVDYKEWWLGSLGMSATGFIASAVVLLRRFRRFSRELLGNLLIGTILPGIASTIVWLPTNSIGETLPILVIGSLLIVLVAAIGANQEWERGD